MREGDVMIDIAFHIPNRTGEALVYLMSRFAVQQSPWLAMAIASHLEELVEQGDADARQRYRQLLTVWSAIAEKLEQKEMSMDHGWRVNLVSTYIQDLQERKLAVGY
jgi:hypothetical protein